VPRLVSSPPLLAPCASRRWRKRRSARHLVEECPLRQRSWGRPFGARGYCWARVGQRTAEMIQASDSVVENDTERLSPLV
jgi:REP element-mobilizing transposase RayT